MKIKQEMEAVLCWSAAWLLNILHCSTELWKRLVFMVVSDQLGHPWPVLAWGYPLHPPKEPSTQHQDYPRFLVLTTYFKTNQTTTVPTDYRPEWQRQRMVNRYQTE